MKNTKTSSVLILTECAVMIALSTVLSILKIIDLPYGGSVTAASMLPIVIAVYRHGTLRGLGIAAVCSTLQLLLGLNTLSYAVNWQAAVAIILFDYIVAFSVFALAGVFRGKIKGDSYAVLLGIILSSLLRYLCHTIVGCTVWAGISIPTGAAIIYSLSYNATYMIPETVILAVSAVYLFSVLDFSSATPKRIKRVGSDKASSVLALLAGAVMLSAIITDVALVFSKLQNEESGELDFSGIVNVNFTALITVTLAALVICAALVAAIKIRRQKSNA